MFKWKTWMKSPLFFGAVGVISMILVIWLARTSFFYLCYLPLVISAKLITAQSVSEFGKKQLPNWLRLFSFVAGMFITELLFSFLLIAQNELSFDFAKTQSSWIVLAVELILGIIIFLFFFGISVAFTFFLRKYQSSGK
jgi:hypothetical protein